MGYRTRVLVFSNTKSEYCHIKKLLTCSESLESNSEISIEEAFIYLTNPSVKASPD
jgi:hypothetical protein